MDFTLPAPEYKVRVMSNWAHVIRAGLSRDWHETRRLQTSEGEEEDQSQKHTNETGELLTVRADAEIALCDVISASCTPRLNQTDYFQYVCADTTISCCTACVKGQLIVQIWLSGLHMWKRL